MRYTKSCTIALERMMAALNMDPTGGPTGSAAKKLAHLITVARVKHLANAELKDQVRWTGPIPARVKGWQHEALRWLIVERPARKPKPVPNDQVRMGKIKKLPPLRDWKPGLGL